PGRTPTTFRHGRWTVTSRTPARSSPATMNSAVRRFAALPEGRGPKSTCASRSANARSALNRSSARRSGCGEPSPHAATTIPLASSAASPAAKTVGRRLTSGTLCLQMESIRYHLELTPEQLKITHTALRSLLDDFGHDE